MLTLAYSQVELRRVVLSKFLPAAPLPGPVPGNGSLKLIYTVDVPENEHWFIIGGSLTADFDSAFLLMQSGYGRLRDPASVSGSFEGIVFPAVTFNLAGDTSGSIGVSLQGVEAPARWQVAMKASVSNSDAAIHNVIEIQAELLVRPSRLVTSLETSRIQTQRGETSHLNQRLIFGGGR